MSDAARGMVFVGITTGLFWLGIGFVLGIWIG